MTVTLALPAFAMSLAEILAVIVVLFTKVLYRPDPFHETIAPLTKPVPLTVNVKVAPPALVLDGLIDVRVGAAGPLLLVAVPSKRTGLTPMVTS